MHRMVSKCIVGVGLVVLMVGCSAFRGSTQVMTIKTSVPDAEIYVNGNEVGKSPVSTAVSRNRDTSIIARKQGYEPASRTIGNHFNETGALDAVGTLFLLFPGIGLFTPGAWSVDNTDIMIQMFPTKVEASPSAQQNSHVSIQAQASAPASGVKIGPIERTWLDQLKELKELKDAGLLTEEEYQEKRKPMVEQLQPLIERMKQDKQ